MPTPPRPTPAIHADEPLAVLDAVATADAIASGELAKVEAFEAAVERAERLNPQLDALLTPAFQEGRAALAAGDPDAPLFGVPTAVKDLSEQAGIRTTFGTLASAHHISPRTDPPVAQLLATGLVSIGKTAAPEYGMTPTAETPGFAVTRNPWDPSRTCGGSSSGAGALVAAGIVPLAHGSDGGGSIRIPASCCGLVGLKPSRGRLVEDPTTERLPVRLISHGVLTRTVRDTAAYLVAAEAQAPPANLPPSGAVPAPGEGQSPPRRRIGVVTSAPTSTLDPQVVAATRRAADDLAGLGHHVEEVIPPFGEAFGEDFLRFWGVLALGVPLLGLQQVGTSYRPGRLDPWTKGLAAHARRNLLAMPATIRRLRRFARDYAAFMADIDVLLTPTLGLLPPVLGWLDVTLPFEAHRERVVSFVPFTPAWNVSGAPAISVPLALSREGLPIGIQLGGRFAEDRILLELASELEAAVGFNRPLHG